MLTTKCRNILTHKQQRRFGHFRLLSSFKTIAETSNTSNARHLGARKLVASLFSRKYSEGLAEVTDGLVHKEPWQWSIPEGHDTGISVRNSYYCVKSKKDKPRYVPLVVRDPGYVTWFACGPTVYDSSHIGHAATYLQFDMIRRVLTHYFGLNVCMVMGITNMDNKIINRALLHDKGIMEVADHYESEFKEDMESLNILPPTTYIRVTDVIPQIIDFIQKILDSGQAYVTETGNVYFSYNDAHQSVAKLREEFYEPDVSAKTEKKFIKDICMWKGPQPGEPYWDAPWGKGRPGWHIECSVMASMCFGDKLDLHSGAHDLQFPHHEYEIAQCDAYHGCYQWVNYFLHSGLLTVPSGEKMSKSLGNIFAIRDCLQQHGPDFLRMTCARFHWQKSFGLKESVVNTSLENIENIRNFLTNCDDIMSGKTHVKVDHEEVLKALAVCEASTLNKLKSNFNIPNCMNNVFRLMVSVNENTAPSSAGYSDVSSVVRVATYVERFLDVLGFRFHKRSVDGKR